MLMSFTCHGSTELVDTLSATLAAPQYYSANGAKCK